MLNFLKNRKLEALLFSLIVIFILIFFKNNTLHCDEVTYMLWNSWGYLSCLDIEGKEPLPLAYMGIIFNIFGYSIYIARIAVAVVGGIFAGFVYYIFRKININILFPVILLFGAAYFVFYSRIYMIEIFLITIGVIYLYGIVIYRKNSALGLVWIYICSLAGSLTKASFLLLVVLFPLFYVIYFLSEKRLKSIFTPKKDIIRFILANAASVAGYCTCHLLIYFAGYYDKYIESKYEYSKSFTEILKSIINFDLNSYTKTFRFLMTDIGFGVIIGYGLLLIYLLYKRKVLFVLMNFIGFSLTFIIIINAVKIVFARYFILTYPVLIFCMYAGLSLIRNRKLLYMFTVITVVLQVPALVRTTIPLLINSKNLHWTRDEILQHHTGVGTFGILPIYDKILELGKNNKVDIEFQGLYSEYFELYLKIFHKSIFENKNKSIVKLRYIKANRLMMVPDDQRVLIFVDQRVKGIKSRGFLYLLRAE
jgi:hypothetical protein